MCEDTNINSINPANDDSENPKPSAPRYESIVNLQKFWRTSFAKLPEINRPPEQVHDNKEYRLRRSSSKDKLLYHRSLRENPPIRL